MEKKNDKSFERLTIRTGEPRDVPVILRFIKELAEYEGIGNRVTATERGLMKTQIGRAHV